MLNRLTIVLLSFAIVFAAITFARASVVPPNSQNLIPQTVEQRLERLETQVDQLQKQQAALEKRVVAMEGPVKDYKSLPCKGYTGIPITQINGTGNYPSPVNRLVLCALML